MLSIFAQTEQTPIDERKESFSFQGKLKRLEEACELEGLRIEAEMVIELLNSKDPEIEAETLSLIDFFAFEKRFSQNDAERIFEMLKSINDDKFFEIIGENIDNGNEPIVWLCIHKFVALNSLCRNYPVISAEDYEGRIQNEFLSKLIRVLSVRRDELSERCENVLMGLITASRTTNSCMNWLDGFIKSIDMSGPERDPDPYEICVSLVYLWRDHPILGEGRPMNYVVSKMMRPKIKKINEIVKEWSAIGQRNGVDNSGRKDQAMIVIRKIEESEINH